MSAARSVTANFVTIGPTSAMLRFNGAAGSTTQSIVQNSGTPVTFAWATQNLPSGTTCRILRRPNNDYGASASPVASGTKTDTGIHTWGTGSKVFYLGCSNGTNSPDITLTITPVGGGGGTPSATLRFDSVSSVSTWKAIVRNSGTPVTFAWRTQNLPSGTTCRILRRPNNDYGASASPVASGTKTDTGIHTWATGSKAFYLSCSNGTTSPDITLIIVSNSSALPSATLRFDSTTGPTSKTIVRKSGTPVTFAWTTQNLPSGTTCRILRRPNNDYGALASPLSFGSRTDTGIHTWAAGEKLFYLSCSNGVTTPDITLTISTTATYALSVQKSGDGSGTVPAVLSVSTVVRPVRPALQQIQR